MTSHGMDNASEKAPSAYVVVPSPLGFPCLTTCLALLLHDRGPVRIPTGEDVRLSINTGRVGIQVEGRHTLICGLGGVAGAVSIHLATVSGHTNVTSLRAASEISARSTRDLRETGAHRHLAGTLPSAGRCARCRRRHLLFCSSILKRGHRTRSARAMRRTQVKCACPVFPKLARGSQSKCVGVAHVCIVDHSRDPLRTSIYGSGVLLAGQEADM